MPQTLKIDQFSGGWTPGADPISGPKNGLLNMDALELDQTGALKMSGGSVGLVSNNNYAADAHTLYSKFISGNIKHYVATTNSHVYREATSLTSTGSATRTAFNAAFNYVFIYSNTFRVRDSGAATSAIGVLVPTTGPSSSTNGGGNLTGQYEYAQINVANFNGSYIAKSQLVIDATPVTANANKIQVTPENPAVSTDPNANEAWIFRRSYLGNGNLQQWTRIARLTAGTGYATFDDNMSDFDAIAGGVFFNIYLMNTDSTGLPDVILDMVGLINGRMIFFSSNSIYFGEINCPDLYDTRSPIGFGGNQNTGTELFLWAKKFGENLVIFGTTQDIYMLSGTFTSNPDGTLDVYLRSLGVENPPISISASIWGIEIVFMAADGWKLLNIYTGQTTPLCPPILDRLYRSETLQGYGGVPIALYPAVDSGANPVNYFCAVARNKLWVLVPQIVNNNLSNPYTYYLQVYDFIRKYWRALPDIKPIRIFAGEDDILTGFFSEAGPTRNLRTIDDQTNKKLAVDPGVGGSGNKQAIHLKSIFFDLAAPRVRNDLLTIKFLLNTGSIVDFVNVFLNVNDGNIQIPLGTLASNGISEQILPIPNLGTPYKNIQLEIQGTVADFYLSAAYLEFEGRPVQLLQYLLLKQDFGQLNGNKKRIRTWPITIDTQNQNVDININIDGTYIGATTFKTSGKSTYLYQFNLDAFGIDFGLKLTADTTTPFELYEIGQPELVQVVPVAKLFWQSGPIELFGSSFIRQLEIRGIGSDNGNISWFLYGGDIVIDSGNFQFLSGQKEDSVYIPIKRIDGSNSARIFRVELGPNNTVFYPYYVRAQIVRSGAQKDTENAWIDLNMEKQSAK